jgi:tripartite ATP-independent transporter DctP family solute receptor
MRKLIPIGLLAAVLVILAGPRLEAATAKLGHLAPTNDPRHEVMQAFAAKVAEGTGGAVQIEIFPDSTLGGEREMFEQAQAGITELALVGSIVANFQPEWSIIDMPYLWKDSDHLERFVQSAWAERWSAAMAERLGVEMLAFLERNPRILTTTRRPVRAIEDLRGLKVRVPNINVYTDTWRAFGVEPVPMPAADIYMGLRLGTIEGMENPVEVMYHWKISEVSRYLSLTNHTRAGFFLIASKRFMDGLAPEHREVVRAAARETTAALRRHNEEGAATLFDRLRDAGMEIVEEPDLSGFIAAAQQVHEKYMDQFGRDAYEAALALAEG